MSHPIMFDDADPTLARVRELALGFPGAAEKVSHGRPVFYTRTIFAQYGGSVKVDGQYVQHGESLIVKPDAATRAALLERDDTYAPAYLASSGWVGVLIDEASDWDELAELVEESYRNTAGARLVAELDARAGLDIGT